MASITNPPERQKLLDAVAHAFDSAGWTVEKRNDESHDFRMVANSLCLLVKCVDETRISYESPSNIVVKLERYSRELRNLRNRQLVVVFGRDFLGVPVESLIERDIFAVRLDDIEFVWRLAEISDRVPGEVSPRQDYLLRRANDYAAHVSKLYRDAGDTTSALLWARIAVEHCVGYSYVYNHLFGLLKALGDLDAAAEVGNKIRQYRSDDPQFIRSMADLERKRGDKDAAARWMARLTEQPTTPRSFAELIAKQRRESGSPTQQPGFDQNIDTPKSRVARFIAGFRRHAAK